MKQRIVKKATKWTDCECCHHYTKKGNYYIHDDETNTSYCSYCSSFDYGRIIRYVMFTYKYIFNNWNAMFPCNLNGYEDLIAMIWVIAWEVEAVLKVALTQEGVVDFNTTRKKNIVTLYEYHLRLSKICKVLDEDKIRRIIANDTKQLSEFIDSTLGSFYDD